MGQFAIATLYLLKDLLAVTALFLIFKYVLREGFNFKSIKVSICFLAYILIAYAGNLLLPKFTDGFDIITDFLSNVMYIVTLLIMLKRKKTGRIIWCVFLCVCTTDVLYSLLSSLIPSGLITEYVVNIILYSIIILTIWILSIKSEINILPAAFNEIPQWIFCSVILFEFTCYYKEFGLSEQWYQYFYIFSSLLVITCFGYFLYKIFNMAHQQNEVLQQFSQQKDFSESKSKSDEEIRRFRHDYQNHIIIVNAYLENGDTEKAKEYLNAVNMDFTNNNQAVQTGNFVADTILNVKQSKSLNSNICISFCGFIPPYGIEDKDLSTILSNLIDNAIEACEKVLYERIIEIDAQILGTFFVLSISNPININSTDNNLKTTKVDKKNHGIGLKNIKRAIQKYDGVFTTEIENNKFTADIRLKLNKNTNPSQ